LVIDIPFQPRELEKGTTKVNYQYNAMGEVIRKNIDSSSLQYVYDNLQNRKEVIQNYETQLLYYPYGLKKMGNYSFHYDAKLACQYILLQNGIPTYSDSIYVRESNDSIFFIRNSLFSIIKYKTYHEFYFSQSTREYLLIRKRIEYYSNSQKKFLPTASNPDTIFKIKYLEDFPVRIKRPVLEDIFRLSEEISFGSTYHQIHLMELLFLEEKLPLKFPLKIISSKQILAFDYWFGQENNPDIIYKHKMIVNLQNKQTTPVLFKFFYPHE
jgi:hypothetical protein